MTSLAIIGAGGHGKVVADSAEQQGNWTHIDFYDDKYPAINQCAGWKVVGNRQAFSENRKKYQGVIVAIGDNKLRLNATRELLQYGIPVATVIHPSARISRYAEIGIGSVVFANACINIGSVIGMAAIINTAAVIEHDCSLAAGVHISPNAALGGGVSVGECSWVGIGASVRHLIKIGSNSIVGAGAVVVADIEDSLTVVGSPAKSI